MGAEPMSVPEVVNALADDRGYTDVRPVGGGLEFQVFAAVASDGAGVVLRCAKGGRFQSNANDRDVDTRALLRWEQAVTQHVAAFGIPVATPRELVFGETDVLVSEFVPDDGGGADQVQLGVLLRRLHSLPPPLVATVAGGTAPMAEVLSERIASRWRELAAVVPGFPAALPIDALADALTDRPTDRLVHLDVRSANLRSVGGRVVGLLDWSNALVGDPMLELGRLAEYARLEVNGLDMDAVFAGYGGTVESGTAAFLVYRLDAAVMLAVVFHLEAPDEELGHATIDRVYKLHERLARMILPR